MAEVRTSVELTQEEIEDVVLAAARAHVKDDAGREEIRFCIDIENESVTGAVVTFTAKVQLEEEPCE